MTKLMLSSYGFLFLLISCNSAPQKTIADRDQLLGSINSLEQKLKTQKDVQLDTITANNLVEQSMSFVKTFPSDSLAANILFKAADVSRGVGHYQMAIDLWDRFYREYPLHKKAPIALFLKAFTTDKDQKDIGKATAYYQKFLEKYPDHPQAHDAQMLLDMLQSDQSPEELIKQFEKNNEEE